MKGLVVVIVEWPMIIEKPDYIPPQLQWCQLSTQHISTAIVIVEIENVPCFVQTH